jgi:hypothetical protein
MRGVNLEIRLRVIEADVFPISLVVAAFAFIPKLAFVRFIRPVASRAIRGSIPVKPIRHMAGPALDIGVLFPQGIIGQPMIEARGREDDDALISSGMIGVADIAGLVGRLKAAVIAAAGGVVSCDLLVAIEAEARLRSLVERSMAGFACRFILRMLRSERSRRYELLEDCLRRSNRRGAC